MATAIIGIMAGGIMSSFTYGFSAMRMVRENQRATQIILEKVESIRLYRWEQVNTPGFIPATFNDVYDPQADTNSQGVTYYGTVLVTNASLGTTYAPKVREVTVTLQWTNCNLARFRTLSTLIAEDGIQNYVY
jgi:type II secretory pathway pseudopilin PulG